MIKVEWRESILCGVRLTIIGVRLGYLAPIQLLHALLVGPVAKALARTRQAAQFQR